jgi:hypothetical protein
MIAARGIQLCAGLPMNSPVGSLAQQDVYANGNSFDKFRKTLRPVVPLPYYGVEN